MLTRFNFFHSPLQFDAGEIAVVEGRLDLVNLGLKVPIQPILACLLTAPLSD